jgi:general secretion pathway protein G
MLEAKGFTLIELVVVVLILALLAGIVFPNVIGRVGGARIETARIQIGEIGSALDVFRLEVGRYPTSAEGLQALIQRPSNVAVWNGPYLKHPALPRDPWGNPYRYRSPGKNGLYDLFTLGRDNRKGGENEDSDVTSWQ